MIILRYLSRELLQTTFAVTLVLMIVIMSGRFVKYLAEAAAGKFDPSVLLAIMYYRLPGFLELILPLGFMVAILMAYGRLYAEHEMTVLFSCGVSQKKLVGMTYVPALLVAGVVGLCSLWLTPSGLQKADNIIQQQKNRSELELIKPGRFQSLQDGKLVSYVESQESDQPLDTLFIATMGVAIDDDVITVRAKSAERVDNTEYQERYLLLNEGTRYLGRPGQASYRITEFEGFAQHLPETDDDVMTRKKINALPTAALLSMNEAEAQLTLQWRISAPVLIIVITLLGVTMSYTTPRRGRYVMLFPSILLYLVYLVVLNAARGSIEDGKLSPTFGLWYVHGLFFGFAVFLFLLRTNVLRRLFSERKRKNTVKEGAQ